MLNNCYRKLQKSSFKNEKASDLKETAIPMFSNSGIDTSKTIMNRELGLVIENALSQLQTEYRTVFALRALNGLSIAETAEVLAITESNVKVRLNRAKTMLKKEIEKSYSNADIFEFNLIFCDQMVNRVMEKIG